MTSKETARLVIEALPDDASLDDIIHALYIKAKFERGEGEIRDGRGASTEQARQRLGKWAG